MSEDESEYDGNNDNFMDDDESSFGEGELELFAEMIDCEEDMNYDEGDLFITEYHKGEIQTFSNIEVASVFKEHNVNYSVNSFSEVKVSRIKPGIRSYRKLCNFEFESNVIILTTKNNTVFANGHEVGVAKKQFPDLTVNCEGIFDLADAYVEEVKGKGSGYGFSSFCHLMATISLRLNPGYLEPYEGCDYTLKSELEEFTIEVTGMSYKSRKTTAKMVLNKYAILQMTCQDPRVLRCIELSNFEETNETSFLRNSTFFNKTSPYTDQFDKIHEMLRLLKSDQVEEILRHVSKWLLSTNDTYIKIHEAKPRFEFIGDKDGKFPCPFKIRCFPYDEKLVSASPESNLWKDNSGIDWYLDKHSSYRTVDKDDDYIALCTQKSICVPRVNEHWHSVAEKAVDILEKLQAVQTSRLYKEMLDKIYKTKGCYYSEKDGVGISWSTTGKECLTYNCIFYASEDPNDEKSFGKWTREKNYYRSPGFKVSRQDINFAKKNYDAMICTYISMINIHEDGDEYDDFISLYTVLTCNSSWKTSDFADNCRFVTTGHFAGNDVKNLLVAPINVGKPIRSSEFLYMHLCNRFLDNPPPRNLTPLFRLPLKHMCLEKDLGLAVNWPNRRADHDTECCRKMILRTVEEVNAEKTVVKFYKEVVSYMAKLLSVGVDYDETKKLLDTTPEEPVLNPIFYLAMCKACSIEIESAASSQVNTGFCLNEMVTDRGSIKYNKKTNTWLDAKVSDEIRGLVFEYKIKGPYDGLLKLFEEKHEKVYLIRSKNGRGRREFATQHIKSRYIQLFEEKLASGISMSAPDDQFLNPHKYNEMVSGFANVLSSSRPVIGSSEDRSYHCGHNMPEGLAVASLCHAVVNSVPYFVTLSAIKRCNTTRLCIMPDDFNYDILQIPKILNPISINYISKNVYKRRQAFEVRKHAMQGMNAIISGVLNTTHVKGIENIMQSNTRVFRDSHVFTTQDDVGRAVSVEENVDPTWIQGNYLIKPMRTLNMTLQKNNERKHVVIEHHLSTFGIMEVNNILMTSSGMVTQSHIHPHHIIQPLTSDSIIIDIISTVSNSRQSVFWGDSPVLAWCCYEMTLYTLRMKWLMTKGEINYLKEIKMIPSSTEELISGFFPRTLDALKIFINCNTNEDLELVVKGEKSLYDKAANYFSKSWKSDQHEVKAISDSGLKTFDFKSKSVYSARCRKGKLRSSVVKPLAPSMRLEVKTRFMDAFKRDMKTCDLLEKLQKMKPPDVKAILRPMFAKDKMPCIMGEVVGEQGVNSKNLICNKILGTNYRTELTEGEKILLEKDTFWEDRMDDLRYQREEGFEIHSPSGLPVVRFMGNKKFIKPMVYNFSIKLSRPSREPRPFVYRGTYVVGLKPCIYGRASCSNNEIMCFAIGYINGTRKAFYKEGLRGKLSCIDASNERDPIVSQLVRRGKAARYINMEDWSPLETGYNRHVPGVEGTPVAMVNYAGFLRSNSERGFQALQELFLKLGSFMPYFMRNYFPDFPRFHPNHVTVKASRCVLMGETMISKIKVDVLGSEIKHYNIIDNPSEIVINKFVF